MEARFVFVVIFGEECRKQRKECGGARDSILSKARSSLNNGISTATLENKRLLTAHV